MDAKNEKKYRALVSAISILLIALLTFLALFLVVATSNVLMDNPLTSGHANCVDMLNGWSYADGSAVDVFRHQTTALVRLDAHSETEIYYSLQENIPDTSDLFFRADCHSAALSVNGEEVYSFLAVVRHTSEEDMFREFSIELPSLHKGDTLMLRLSAENTDKIILQFPCCGETNAVRAHVFKSCREAFIVSIFAILIIFVGLIVYFYHLSHGKNHTDLLFIVLFALVSLFWICTDSGLAILFLPYNLTLYFINYSLPLLLLVIYFLFVQTAAGKKLKGFFVISLICLLTLLAGYFLHFSDVISLRRQLPYAGVIMLLAGIISTAVIICSLPNRMIYFKISSVMLTLAIGATAFLYHRLQVIQSTVIFRYVLVIFSFVMLIVLIRGIHNLDQQAKQTERLQREKEAAEAKMLLSQINSHFFYNTINTIRGLIKYDPDSAYKMTGDFGKYVRYRVNSASTDVHLSTFKEELRAIRAYADICVIRLNGKLDMQYQIEADDFYIPTLTVEPFVENAIHHGIYHGSGEGCVTICAEKLEGFWKVTVKDNGCGFDLASLDNTKSIGISNVRTRLSQYPGCELKIDSTPLNGTCVTILYPDMIGGQEDETDPR